MEVLIAFVALVIAVIALVKSSQLREEGTRLRLELARIGGRLQRMEDQARESGSPGTSASMAEPIAEPVTATTAAVPPPAPIRPRVIPPEPVLAATSSVAPGMAVPPPLPSPATPRTQPASPSQPVSTPPPVPARTAPSSAPSGSFDWEQFLGARLLSWLGGLILFLAVAFFVKLSFERGWVPPSVRAAGGFALGVGLIAGGMLMKRRESLTTSQTLCATGVLTLYGVTYACHALYQFPLFSVIPTFGLMAVITAVAFGLALRLEAQVVAVLGMLGGFLTPGLLSTGENNPGGLFSYLALLDAGLLAVVWRRRWDYLAPLAALGTFLMQAAWYGRFFTADQLAVLQVVVIGFAAGFTVAYALAHRGGWASRWLALAASGLAVMGLAAGFNLVADSGLADRTGGIFLIALAADLVLLSIAFLRSEFRRLETVGGGLLFLLLTQWMLVRLDADKLGWALGLSVGFALLHTLFPLWVRRLQPGVSTPVSSQLFPALGLLLMVAPLLKELPMPWTFWPVVAVVDVLAVGVAVLSGSVLALVLVLCLSLGLAGIWLNVDTGSAGDLTESLVVVGGFAVFFFGAACFVSERLSKLATTRGRFATHQAIPGFAALLPFALLSMVTVKLAPSNPSSIFAVVLFLNLLAIGWAAWSGQHSLTAVALGCTAAVQWAWFGRGFQTEVAGVGLAWTLGFFLLFTVVPFLRPQRFLEHRVPWAVSAMAGPVQFALVYRLVQVAWLNDFMGVLPALFALPAIVGLLWIRGLLPESSPLRLHHLAWFGGVALFFITLIFPIQFDRQVLTVSWALEGAALVWLFRRIPHQGLLGVGLALLVVAFVRLTLNPAVLDYARSGRLILNWYLYTYGLVTVALFCAARLHPTGPTAGVFARAPGLLYTLGTILSFVLVNLEIADAFASGPRLTLEFSGNLARDLSYTVAWAVFAFVLLVIGLRQGVRFARYAGLALMGITLGKLLLHDLARLEQLYRIGAFVAVAVLSMVASFLYQRLRLGPTPGEKS